jgi:hypothetical protein
MKSRFCNIHGKLAGGDYALGYTFWLKSSMNSNRGKVIAYSDLVSLPLLYLESQRALYSEECSMHDLTDLSCQVPPITARLLSPDGAGITW